MKTARRVLLVCAAFALLLSAAHGAEKWTAGICPVMKGKTSPNYSTEYQGKTYYFCCSACISAFKKDPQKYLDRIKEITVAAKRYEFTPAEIKVKEGDIVRLTLAPEDVRHGLAIPGYGIDIAADKGEKKTVEFLTNKKGTFPFHCSVFCGMGHAKMQGKLIVE